MASDDTVYALPDDPDPRTATAATVADLAVGRRDPMGDEVLEFRGRNPPHYAVYMTRSRMKVMFADEAEENARQRRALAPLNPLRGEIVGLIDGWRDALETDEPGAASSLFKPWTWPRHWRRRRAARSKLFNRQVGDALIVALEDDVDGALGQLGRIKQEILDARVAWARFQYLLAAFGQGVVVALAVWLLSTIEDDFTPVHQFGAAGWDVLHAAGAGAIGAFFSIALAIRGRTVLPDLQWVANLMDASLRMVIGVLAGAILMALITTRTVQLQLGEATLGEDGTRWLTVLVIGVIAGFSERLVPDLLEKASTRAPPPEPVAKPPALKAEDAARPDGGKPENAHSPDRASGLADETADDDEGHGHDCEDDLVGDDATRDEDLPAAAGGVAAR